MMVNPQGTAGAAAATRQGLATFRGTTTPARCRSSRAPSSAPGPAYAPEQADRWTWLIISTYTQFRLARSLTEDLRRPWEAPLDPDRLTPAESGADFRASTAQQPRVAMRKPGPNEGTGW
jgi:hypothetical protein